MRNLYLIPFFALTFFTFVFPVLPYTTANAASHIQTDDSTVSNKAERKTAAHARRIRRKQRLMQADSMRIKMREAADAGNMLQWVDSLIYSGKTNSPQDSAKRAKRLARLANADEKLSFANRLITKKYYGKNIDTSYIMRPREPWTIKFRNNLSFVLTGIRGVEDNSGFSGFWASRARYTLSFGASYRGIGLSAAVNPAKLAGKSKDMEYLFTSYGNRMGFDIIYEAAKTDKGSITCNGEKYNMPKGSLNRRSLAANYYYAFNGKRFSFPAAFTQSYIQRRSAGSWLIAAAAQWRQTRITPGSDSPVEKAETRTVNFAVGGGYGHNFCLGENFMLHLSSMPAIVVFDHSSISGDDIKRKGKLHFPNFFVTSRAALLYSWKRNFAGVSGIADFSNIGNRKQLELFHMKWRARLFYGFRF